MITKWNDSYFVVTFTGERPQSTLIKGWGNVLTHIDHEMGNDDEYTVSSPCCELHDPDNWTLLAQTYADNDDERHTFGKSEFGYCVGLYITRVTEPIAELV